MRSDQQSAFSHWTADGSWLTAQMAQMTLLDELKLIAGLQVRLSEPLALHTSMKIGGPADYFLEVEALSALGQTLRLLDRYGISFSILGKGSNVLVSDLGVRGAVIRLGGEFKQIEWREQDSEVLAAAGAACPMTQLVRAAARKGYGGLEFAEGIPGSVGGALVMNAGAYGSEMEKIVVRVEGLTQKGEPVQWSRAEMVFSYRDSHLPAGTLVTRVCVRLSKARVEEVGLKVRELVARRKKSQPSGYPNSGSMFRNPPGDFAGRLIEAAGLKGRRIGKAAISEKHANFIVNLGGAKAGDVRRLMEIARLEVEKKFAIELEPEVRLLGEWSSGAAGD